jgi:hypothetical protein
MMLSYALDLATNCPSRTEEAGAPRDEIAFQRTCTSQSTKIKSAKA